MASPWVCEIGNFLDRTYPEFKEDLALLELFPLSQVCSQQCALCATDLLLPVAGSLCPSRETNHLCRSIVVHSPSAVAMAQCYLMIVQYPTGVTWYRSISQDANLLWHRSYLGGRIQLSLIGGWWLPLSWKHLRMIRFLLTILMEYYSVSLWMLCHTAPQHLWYVLHKTLTESFHWLECLLYLAWI